MVRPRRRHSVVGSEAGPWGHNSPSDTRTACLGTDNGCRLVSAARIFSWHGRRSSKPCSQQSYRSDPSRESLFGAARVEVSWGRNETMRMQTDDSPRKHQAAVSATATPRTNWRQTAVKPAVWRSGRQTYSGLVPAPQRLFTIPCYVSRNARPQGLGIRTRNRINRQL